MQSKLLKIIFIIFSILLFSNFFIKTSYASCPIAGTVDCTGIFTASNFNYNPDTKILKFNSTDFNPDNDSYLPYGYRAIGLYDITQIPAHSNNSFANDTYGNFETCSNSGCTGAHLDNIEGVTNIGPNDIVQIFVEYLTYPNGTIYLSQQILYSDLIGNSAQNISLNVPLLKQTSSPWKNQIYDSANVWNPRDPSINSWGCAITSAAMIFNYNGINKLPNNTILDPGTLNLWLKKQKDGYIGNGLVNWLALSRLSKQSRSINNLAFDALEYSRTNGNATQKLTEALTNNTPGILREPGHFIVAKGVNNNIFSINDPYYSRTSLSDYGNSFQNLGIYTPSNTDLSYIMLTVNPNIDIQLFDSNNNPVGETFTEGPIINPLNSNQNTGSLKIIYLQKPPSGSFKVILSSNGNSTFTLNEYLYDKDGDVFVKSDTGIISQGNDKTIDFNFNGGNLYDKKATYLSTALDIEKFRKQKLITNEATRKTLDDLLAIAFVQNVLKDEEKEEKTLNEIIEFLGKNEDKILEPANSTLLYDINYLGSQF